MSRHMSQLYERYSREARTEEGNTVRSFRTSRDSSGHRTVYHLNLTTLQDSEVVLSAAFHFPLDRRPRHKPWSCRRFKSPACRSSTARRFPSVSLLLRSASSGSKVASGSMGSFLGNVTFHPHRRGAWQMKDVTQVIKEARNRGHLLVSVELDVGKPEERLSAGALPYLLLYADDRALAEPNSVAASLQRYHRFEGHESSPSPRHARSSSSSPEPRGRARREATPPSSSIENNELPEVHDRPHVHRKDELWESTWHLALKPKPGRKEKKAFHRRGEDGRGEQEPPALTDQQGARRGGPEAAASDERRRERKDERRHEGGADPRSPVLSFDAQTMRRARRRQWDEGRRGGCSRRSLRVDFADIGWSEWVLAPAAFDAYYCAGTCGFPMQKVARPSNHATIQSIVRAVGIIPGVPEPCCVPEKMSPLTVLYQDESTNRVLKVYPNMSVQSCSCR